MALNNHIRQVVCTGANRQPSYVTSFSPLLSEQDLADGELLLKILFAAICNSDLDRIGGNSGHQEISALGHEGVGQVIISKRSTDDLKPGDDVVFCSPFLCNSHADKTHKWSRKVNSYESDLFEGAFSTHLVLGPGVHIEKLPANIPLEVATSINCPLATMVYAIQSLNLQKQVDGPNLTATILGAGILGIYGCAVLKESGFKTVYVVDDNEMRWQLVEKFGGLPILKSQGIEFKTSDVIIDTVGDDRQGYGFSPVDNMKYGGIYIVIANHHKTVSSISFDQLVKKNLTIKGVGSYSVCSFRKAVDFLSKTIDIYPYEQLTSPPFGLSHFSEALSYAEAGHYHRVLLKPND